MTKNKVAILYIGTGKYIIFWSDFYKSCEQYFLNNDSYEKHYYIFTDTKQLEFEEEKNVHKIYQSALKWPYITLDRFKIFQHARTDLETMDYIYFFNGNMLFVDNVGEEILPTFEKPLVLVKHPGFFDEKRENFTYDTNKKSLAYIPDNQGKSYFMGGLNGGTKEAYLNLVDQLEQAIDKDKSNGIIAIWHDESHLNRYAIDHMNKIKVMDPSYGYPEGWALPFDPKIIIRDKNNFGGHSFLRNDKGYLKKIAQRFIKWL